MASGKVYKQYILEMLNDIDEGKEARFLCQLYTIILHHRRKAKNEC